MNFLGMIDGNCGRTDSTNCNDQRKQKFSSAWMALPVNLALVILGVLLIIGLAVALILSDASPRGRR